jgi:acyl transferase domain-containing protein
MSGLPDPSQTVAIVGMAGRFPGARSVAELWRNLCGGGESITFFERDELLAAGHDAAEIDRPGYVPAAGFLADADCFDAELFGLAPREAEVMDP